MVCRLIEGWESSTTLAHYVGKWTVLQGASTSIQSGGVSGQYLRLSGTSQPVASRTLTAQGTWVLGFRVRLAQTPSAVCGVLDTATVQVDLLGNADGTLSVRRGGSTVLGTSTATLALNTWYYVELKVVGSGTSGAATVRVNGTAVLTLTGVNTQQTANATANTVRLGQQATSGNLDYDDVYVLDGSGGVNTDFLGDCRVEQVLPTGAGATTAWTPSAGANYAAVDDAPPNGDTDYVSSATAGQTDTYACGDLAVATSGTVKAVQATASCRKDDAGSRSVALVTRPGSTDRVGATQSVLDTYSMLPQVWDTNPDTAAAWTVAEVNASQFGERLIA
jgi:hypothetical protein